MKQFKKVALRGEITPLRPLRIQSGGKEVVILQSGDGYFAFENICPHQQVSMFHLAVVEHTIVTCPMHGWSFDLQTGAAVNGSGRLKKYTLEVRGEEVWIDVPDTAENYSLF